MLIVALLTARTAHGQLPPGCEELVSVEGALATRWNRVLPELCERLDEMPDADAQAQLVLRPEGRDLLLNITLRDGRVAERHLRSPRELVSTVEAVTAVPPSFAAQPETRPAQPPAPPARDDEVPSPPPLPERQTASRFELGAGLMLRAAGAPLYLSAGVQGHAALHIAWLTLALAARWDGFQSVVHDRPRHLEMSTQGGGLWVLGRLLAGRRLTLDAGPTLWVLAVMQTTGEGADERGGDVADVRAGGMLRARFGSGSYRSHAGVDFELSRRRLRDDLRLDRALPTLPAWSLGITIGVAWQAS